MQVPDDIEKMKTIGGVHVSQDIQGIIFQFCQDFGETIDEVLHGCNELLSTIDEFVSIYRPKTLEETDEFYHMKFKLPDSVNLLCDLQKITIPDDEELYDLVVHIKDIAIDIVSRMVSVNVVINNIINMYGKTHEDDMFIHLNLTILDLLKEGVF